MLNPTNPPPRYGIVPDENRPRSEIPQEWSKNLFSCCDDIETCVFTYCCHCFQYAKISSKFTNSSYWVNCLIYTGMFTLLTPCFPVFMGKFREDIRLKYRIPGTFLEDCCIHCWCSCCAMIQESREIELREGRF